MISIYRHILRIYNMYTYTNICIHLLWAKKTKRFRGTDFQAVAIQASWGQVNLIEKWGKK